MPRTIRYHLDEHIPHAVAKACVIIAALGMLNLFGCDPVRNTSQHITITVNDGQGLPVPNASVRIKESWESWQSWLPEAKKDERDYYHKRWQSDFVPWLEGFTNAEGKAAIRLNLTALDGTRGSEPPANRDIVSNREYIIKLQTQDAEDELLAVMKPGTVSSGKRYTVRIETIEKPAYQ